MSVRSNLGYLIVAVAVIHQFRTNYKKIDPYELKWMSVRSNLEILILTTVIYKDKFR